MALILSRDEIGRIAVFRALMLGDVLCATPALRALRGGYPDAQITFIGLPWSRGLIERFGWFDDFVPFPGAPGLPETEPDCEALPRFLAAMRARRFDLALQMHGRGEIVNPLVESFDARHTAGFTPEDPPPANFVRWPRHGHEIERMLALTDSLGLARCGLDLDFPLRHADRHSCVEKFPELQDCAYAVVHPGAQLPSRRWPRERFAAVAAAMEQDGLRVIATGTAGEAALTRAVSERCARAIDLAGRTTLWELAALIENATLIVCNDTGVAHIAAAFGTPSVIISSGADVARWAPLDSARHRVLWAQTPCRPCSHPVCPTRHECATAIEVAAVLHEVAQLRETAHA